MSEDVKEIHRMIQTATIGDGDQVLNILEKVCDKLAALESEAAAMRRDFNNRRENEPMYNA